MNDLRLDTTKMSVLITGAAGEIGTVLRRRLKGRYRRLILADIAQPEDIETDEIWATIDVLDPASLASAFAGVDVVVHLATAPLDAAWKVMQQVNTEGTWNTFEMAAECGVGRVIYTSSNHITGYHSRADTLDLSDPIRPDSHYAVTKAYGEAVARMFVDKKGLSSVVVRIGSFQPAPQNIRMLSTWLSHRDAVQLFTKAIETPGIVHETVYGVSANTRSFWQPDTSALNYRPIDNADDHAEDVLARIGVTDEPPVDRLFQGGDFCGDGYTGQIG